MFYEDFHHLQIARYELTLRAVDAVSLPPFLGSTLRGAFGHALKKAVCVVPHGDCERCMLSDKCIYPYLFETPPPCDFEPLRGQKNAPHPFVLIPPMLGNPIRRIWKPDTSTAKSEANEKRETSTPQIEIIFPSESRLRFNRDDNLRFGLLLMGRAIEYLPYIIYAVSGMARRGLGVGRARFELTEVFEISENKEKAKIYSGETGRIVKSASSSPTLSALVAARLRELAAVKERGALKLRCLTPTRITEDGRLKEEMSFRLLIKNLWRRVTYTMGVHGTAPANLPYQELLERAESVETFSSILAWDDWERYSNRQKRRMPLGGFIGEIEYAGAALEELLPLIVAGEILHIGKNTAFGLGKFKIAP
ncbi:MAG: CRISPR system precrRNA processing endoribonuclease RAMP protein Cas6 [Acidobacteria bacterium]|nr:CRISPR system precrRNA processing endoribonuclease RAMP protein Cas6 [Acidobacteriota bacterium]